MVVLHRTSHVKPGVLSPNPSQTDFVRQAAHYNTKQARFRHVLQPQAIHRSIWHTRPQTRKSIRCSTSGKRVGGIINIDDDPVAFEELHVLDQLRIQLRAIGEELSIWRDSPRVRSILYLAQFCSSLLFVVLYIWSTYSPPPPWTLRWNLDLGLCLFFGADYFLRLAGEENKLQAMLSPWNVCDVLAFLPPLLETLLVVCGTSWAPGSLLRGYDMRFFKLLRGVRVLRVGLLTGEYRSMRLTSSGGALLTSAANVRLLQLVASIAMLLFTTSTLVHIVERIPWHEALWFVTTTLTTVGFGDVVVRSTLGRMVVLALILVGVVLIPVQAGQLYAQLAARRVQLGPIPDKRTPMVLVSARLMEVRGFSDFFSEFFHALQESDFPKRLRMVVLCNKPGFEFRALQELHEKRVTLIEGSALSERDLVTVGADHALGLMLIGDRFSANPVEEDRSLQFQVWAIKSYTKTVPLCVQVLQRVSMERIAPFLDAERDQIVSLEQTRHRLLALSCLCPGASTLLGNLMRTGNVSSSSNRTLAGRHWFRAYANGCAYRLVDAPVAANLQGVEFLAASEWLYRTSGLLSEDRRRVMINPGHRRLMSGDVAVCIATRQSEAIRALRATFAPPSTTQMAEVISDRVRFQVFHKTDSDYFVQAESAPRGVHTAGGEECVDPPFIGQLETESVDDGDGVCYNVWDVVNSESEEGEEAEGGDGSEVHGVGGDNGNGVHGDGDIGVHGGSHQQQQQEQQHVYEDNANGEQQQHVKQATEETTSAVMSKGGGDTHQSQDQPPPQTTITAYGGASPMQQRQQRQQQTQPVMVSMTASALEEGPSIMANQGPSIMANQAPSIIANQAPSISNNGLDSDAYSMLKGSTAASEASNGNNNDNGTPPPTPYDHLGNLQPTSVEYSPIAWDVEEVRGHVIVCGSEHSFVPFVEQLRASSPNALPVVVLHPSKPAQCWRQLSTMGPIFWVKGSPGETSSLRAANAEQARALVFLTHPFRPEGLGSPPTDKALSSETYASTRSRAAVLADSDALLTCYGVGEDVGMERLHSVVELTFTSSVRFLQPGLLLKGVGSKEGGGEQQGPRRGWRMRKAREAAAVAEGLAEWQSNPYYTAGRVTVPALMDTLTCQCFFNKGMLVGFMDDLCGDDGRVGGAMLRQIQLPDGMAGRTYAELVTRLTLGRQLIPLGLYRRKTENPSWRLHYVVTNPPPTEVLQASDRVFVLRERSSGWVSEDDWDSEEE